MIVACAAALAADPLVDGVGDELTRGVSELRLEGEAGPYEIEAQIWDHDEVEVEAMLGGLVGLKTEPHRELDVVVRSGSPASDNTNFSVWPNGASNAALPVAGTRESVRESAWLAIDHGYKGSVEALAAKTAADQRRAEPDDVPDFSAGPPHQVDAPRATPFDPDALASLARDLSAEFLKHPEVEWSRVWLAGRAGRRIMLDTAGNRVVEPRSELVLRVVGRSRADDGTTDVDQVLHVVRTADQLPDRARLLAEVDELCTRLEQFRRAPRWSDDYVGPVLFEGGAALEAVRDLVVPALIGTPPEEEPPTGSRMVVFGRAKSEGPIEPRRRLLPDGWSVDDDPLRDSSRPSAYHYDVDGEPAQAVALVRDGITVGHVMSRVPNEWFAASNGHGRTAGGLVRALPADLRLVPDREASERAIRKAALKEAARYGYDYYLVVRQVRDPALQAFAGDALIDVASLFGLSSSAGLPPVAEVWKVFRDGREEPFRGVQLSGISRSSLKELLDGGAPSTGELLLGSANFFTGPNVGIPVTLTSPSLLFSEVVVQPNRSPAEKPPRLPSPVLAP